MSSFADQSSVKRRLPPLVLLGANTPVGHFFMERAQAQGFTGTALSRRPMEAAPGFEMIQGDLAQQTNWKPPEGSCIISFLPIWVLAALLPQLEGIQRVVATSSTSRFSKSDSADAVEKDLALKLASAEDTLIKWAAQNEVSWTILRPTLIYDGRTDKNVTRMARFIHRWGFLPVAAPAQGLRQPIHTDDVAKATLCALDIEASFNRAFNVAGGEVLSYQSMAHRVFESLGKKPRLIFLPAQFLVRFFRMASAIGLIQEKSFGASFFLRMNQDLIFEIGDGLEILGYAPRPFHPTFYLGT